MTSNGKQWVRAAVAHEATAVPYYFGFSPKIRPRVIAHYGVEEIEDWLGIPIRMTPLKSVKPLYVTPRPAGPNDQR